MKELLYVFKRINGEVEWWYRDKDKKDPETGSGPLSKNSDLIIPLKGAGINV